MTKKYLESSNRLGEFKLVTIKDEDKKIPDIPCKNGFLLFIRPKCYIYFSEEIKNEIEEVGSLREYLKTIDIHKLKTLKYALHGFRGKVTDILEMYRDENNKYIYTHFWKVKESIRQNKPHKIRVVEKREAKINVDWKRERMFCGLTPKQAQETLEMCIYPNSCFVCPYTKEF